MTFTRRLRVAWPVLRAERRARWAAWLALALLVGLAGGVVLTAAAGAQRTGTAFARLLQASHAADVSVTANGNAQGYDQALARLPGVSGLARVLLDEVGYVSLVLPGGARVPSIGADVSGNGRWGTSVDRFTVVQGRMFRPGRADEVVIDPELAAAYRLRPGSTLRLLMVRPGTGNSPALRAILPFRVAGVVVFANQIVPVAPSDRFPALALTPAFYRSRADRLFAVAGDEALVRLRPGTSLGAFTRRASELALRFPQTQGVVVTDLAGQQAKVEQAIQPQADALALFAALAGLAALVVTAQLLSRQLITGASDYPVLSALGADRRQLTALALVRAGAVSAAGGCIAVVIAVAASGLMPIGPARLAEPDPGVQVNAAILGIGFVVIAVLPVLVVAPVAWHVARAGATRGSGPPPGAPSWLAGALARLGAMPTAAIGARLAFEPGRDRSAVPVRSALTGAAIAVAALVAALVFGTSLVGLVDTPGLYGQDWTLGLSAGFGSVAVSGPFGATAALARVPGIAAYAGGNSGQISVDGQQVAAIGIRPLHGGEVFPTLLGGRPPATAGEIALGARTLRQLGRHVGDLVSVQVAPGSRPVRMRVVGEAIFPSFGIGTLTPTGLGDGAAVFAPLLPPSPIGCPKSATCYGFYLIRFRPGTPGTVISALSSRFVSAMTAGGCPPGTCQALTAAAPAAISNYSRVRATPLVLGGLLALLAVALLAQVLVTTTRRRRRDLGVVKTLGFLRRQVSAAVAWQATALAAVALLVGLPLGVAGGRWAWALFAGSVGVGPTAVVPLGAIALTVPATLLLANAIAIGPGWSAARIKPAVTLRNE